MNWNIFKARLSINKLIFTVFAMALLSGPLFRELQTSIDLGMALSRSGDRYSEANAFRAASGFLEEGFLSHYGLPQVTYGTRFPSDGFPKGDPRGDPVYTHYPPGPDLTLAGFLWLWGPENLSAARVTAVLVNFTLTAFGYFLFSIALGPIAATFLLCLAVLAPAFTNYFHGIHYHGYAMSLLFVEWGYLSRIITRTNISAVEAMVVTFCLGLLQGFLSFDYFFLVTLAPLPFWILAKSPRSVTPGVLAALIGALIGFGLAHFAHLWQLKLYYGTWLEAYQDLFSAAKTRSGFESSSWWASFWGLPHQYLSRDAPREEFFGGFLYFPLLLFLITFWAVPAGSLTVQGRPSLCFSWQRRIREIPALIVATGVGLAWLALMQGHAYEHPHFLPRNLLLVYLFPAICMTARLQLEPVLEPSKYGAFGFLFAVFLTSLTTLSFAYNSFDPRPWGTFEYNGAVVTDWRQAWGRLRKNAGIDGGNLEISGQHFSSGFATHAPSYITLQPPAEATQLCGQCGVLDSAGPRGLIRCRVTEGSQVLFDSSTIGYRAPALPFCVAVSSAPLRLETLPAGPSYEYAHVGWVDLQFSSAKKGP